jgi:hypothetical protein
VNCERTLLITENAVAPGPSGALGEMLDELISWISTVYFFFAASWLKAASSERASCLVL